MANSEEMKVDLDSLTAMARRLGFKGKEAEAYIHEHMTKLGYKSKRSYYRDEKGSSGSSTFSFFGSRSSGGSDDGDDSDD